MAADPNSSEVAGADEAALRRYASALADGIEDALPCWVERSVARLMEAWAGTVAPEIAAQASVAGRAAGATVGPQVRALLATDVDLQRTGPLAIARTAVAYATAVLRRAGVPEVERDSFAEGAFPDDVYDLTPASFADLDPELHEVGLVWGAAKAHVVLARRRAEGKR